MRTMIAAAVLLGLTANAQADDANPSDAFKHMAFLAGSCWEGPFPDGKSTDQHCYKWIQDGRYLRDMHKVIGAPKPYYGETTYYWDHDAKVVKYIYWANDGGYSTGTAIPENGAVKYPDERYIGADGTMMVRAETKQIDNDSYSQRAEMQNKEGKWVPFVNSTYKRKPLNW